MLAGALGREIAESLTTGRILSLALLLGAASAWAADVSRPEYRPHLARLCADDARTSAGPEIRNTDRKSVAAMLGIVPRSLVINYRSADWIAPGDVESRAREILQARPRFLSPFINWSEGADLRRQGFVVDILTADGASARLEVAGYQVCVRDNKGSYWYFRNVPLDLWPQ